MSVFQQMTCQKDERPGGSKQVFLELLFLGILGHFEDLLIPFKIFLFLLEEEERVVQMIFEHLVKVVFQAKFLNIF